MEKPLCPCEDSATIESDQNQVREAVTQDASIPNVTRTLKADYNEDQRPREKFLMVGADQMKDDELLAIVLGSGAQNYNVLSVAHAILRDWSNFSWLTRASIDELMRYKGIGRVRAIQLAAVLEIAKRVVRSDHDDDAYAELKTPQAVFERMRGYALSADVESFFVLPVDKKCRLCGQVTRVTTGTLDASIVHPREVFQVGLRWSAASLIVVHNHPSGDPAPSRADLDVTRKLIQAGQILSIPIADHVIIGDPVRFNPGYHSIRRSGVVAFD